MSNWKFVESDFDTNDALFAEKYLEGVIIAPEYDDEEVKILIGKYDKDHSVKYKYFIEATLAPYGDLIFSDDFEDIKELKSALRKLQAQVDEDIEYPDEEDIEKLTSEEEKDKFAWEVKSDYINPEIDSSHQGLVPQLIGRNLEAPKQEIRIYIVPDILSEDEKREAKTDFVLEVANGIDDIEILTAFDNFSDILESLDDWHENQNTEHNLVDNYIHCPKDVLKEFFKRNEEFRRSLQEE